MGCGKDCNCSELKKERDILLERKMDERKATETIFRLREEYMKAVDEIIVLNKVVVSQAKEIERLKK